MQNNTMKGNQIAALIISTLLFPSIGVCLVGADFGTICINFLLTLLGFVPGIIHAWYIILSAKPKSKTVFVPAPKTDLSPSAATHHHHYYGQKSDPAPYAPAPTAAPTPSSAPPLYPVAPPKY